MFDEPRIIAVAYPGQSEAVRVGLGRTAWIKEEGAEWPRSISLGYRDSRPEATHTPEEFRATFPAKPGGCVEGEYRELDGRRSRS